MKPTTLRYLGIAAVSALAVGAASGVLAVGGYGTGMGWGGHQGMMGGPGGTTGMGPGMMMGGAPFTYTDEQFTQLKSTLGITPAQETAWNTFTEALKTQAGVMTAHRATMFGTGGPAPEQMAALHEQGIAQMQQVTDARQRLDAVLTPEQRAQATNLIGPPVGTRWAAQQTW